MDWLWGSVISVFIIPPLLSVSRLLLCFTDCGTVLSVERLSPFTSLKRTSSPYICWWWSTLLSSSCKREGPPLALGTSGLLSSSDPFLSPRLAVPTGWSKVLVVLLAPCSFQESCLQEAFYGKHLIVAYGWTYTSTPSDQCNPLFTGIIWLYFLFTQGGLGGALCTWYQKNSLLRLGAAMCAGARAPTAPRASGALRTSRASPRMQEALDFLPSAS